MKNVIIYATKNGCTKKAAELLKEKLSGETTIVDIEKEKISDLAQYDNVILGGPIYIGKMRKSLYQYMTNNQEKLSTKRLGLFVCAGEEVGEAAEKQLMDAFPKQIYDNAVIVETFGGILDFDKISFFTKFMLKLAVGVTEGYSRLKEDKIKGFAEKMAQAS